MLQFARTVWVDAGPGIQEIAAQGARVWESPAAVHKALAEIIGVIALTHVQISLDTVFGSDSAAEKWRGLLEGKGALDEVMAAIGDAVRGPAVWGVALPCPSKMAALLSGDGSEKSVLRIGMQMASCLRGLRDSGMKFVTIDFGDLTPSGEEKGLAPILRNAELYGWTRAISIDDIHTLTAFPAGVDVAVVGRASVADVLGFWNSGKPVGGGLTHSVWTSEALGERPAPRFVLFGQIPAGCAAERIVAVGRMVKLWLV